MTKAVVTMVGLGRRSGGWFGDDDGNIAIYFTVIATAMMFAMALVVDGGRQMSHVQRAMHLSDNAARACAQHVESGSVLGLDRSKTPTLEKAAARQAAADYMALVGVSDYEVGFADGNTTCVVTTKLAVPTIMLPISDVSATQSAQGVSG